MIISEIGNAALASAAQASTASQQAGSSVPPDLSDLHHSLAFVAIVYFLCVTLAWIKHPKTTITAQLFFVPVCCSLCFLIFDNASTWFKDNPSKSLFFVLPAAIWCFFIFLEVGNWLRPPDTIDVEDYATKFERRAIQFDKEARLILATIFILVIGAAVVFFKADAFVVDDFNTIYNSSGAFERFIAYFLTFRTQPEARYMDPIFLLILIRAGDVAIASFLTFMLVRVYRYNLRMSAFYISRADAYRLHEYGRFKKVKMEILPVLLDANFDFGQDHSSLVDEFVKLIGALNRYDKDSRPSSRQDGAGHRSPGAKKATRD